MVDQFLECLETDQLNLQRQLHEEHVSLLKTMEEMFVAFNKRFEHILSGCHHLVTLQPTTPLQPVQPKTPTANILTYIHPQICFANGIQAGRLLTRNNQ
jgi:hypothetical protein